MAVESVAVPSDATGTTQTQAPIKNTASADVQTDEVDTLQGQVNEMSLGNAEFALHAACAEGNLDQVKAALSKGTDKLETLDVNTGCTPIVLAIRGNQYDIVRELLSAGAIVPPPGLTTDSTMLSILYPQPVYNMPPQFMSIPPQEYYPQPNYFPQQNGGENQQQFAAPRKESVSAPNGSNSNLPPADVSKSIPCRNFPNCKYGDACVFLHPRAAGFYPPGPGPQNGYPVPQNYEGFPPYPPAPAPYFMPHGGNGFQSFQEQPVNGQVEGGAAPVPAGPHVPSAVAPVFVPGFQPGDMMASPPPPSHFGLSPMSPSMLGTSLPTIPPAEVFFAASPPNNGGFLPPPPMANGGPRRQSVGQQFGGQNGKPFGHGKKPSFSGGKPWAGGRPANGTSKFGAWKDGVPPPCAFFNQGNCRNGELCKFPHLDAEGHDCRHPDVVRGVLPPLPPLGNGKRNMRANGPNGGFAPFDPSFRQQQQYQQQMQFLQHQRMAAAQAQQGQAAATPAEGKVDEAVAEEGKEAEGADKEAASAATPANTLPAKPLAAPMPTIIRSASQPGVQRVHANGLSSRSHSPAPSNVSFHGNGHPRRAGRVPNANGVASGRSASSGPEKKVSQRIPGADEFPVLGTPTSEKKEPVWGVAGKTAAQVLQAPAPVKPVTAKSEEDNQPKQSVTMESEDDSDAVLVSRKPSSATTPASSTSPGPPVTEAAVKKAAPISFASVAGSAAPAETAPVALKA
ncbi:hypothetical protein IAR50_002735 [Cryptococcus sp. DSM 104548]